MMEIETYLEQQGHTPQTIRSYTYHIKVFLSRNPQAQHYQYKDVVAYFNKANDGYLNSNYRTAILAAIKRYYDFLIETGKRNDHPCRRLFLKSGMHKPRFVSNVLFSSEELERLLMREERYKDLKLKNQLILSFLIFQAVTPGEIASLRMNQIDLDSGTIFLQGNRHLGSRTIDLFPRQFRLVENYLREDRPKLLRTEKHSDILILNKLGSPVQVDDINYLIETFKPLFPDRNLNAMTIRQSVIANWLNEKRIPLEQVQLLAGHKWIGSTLVYRQKSMDEQRELINKWHPLG
jgi:site-specific recombinase XerD